MASRELLSAAWQWGVLLLLCQQLGEDLIELFDIEYHLPPAQWDSKLGFKSCLHGNETGINNFALLCHNKSCVHHGHRKKLKGYYTPNYQSSEEKILKHITETKTRELREFVCDGTNDQEAIDLVNDGIATSRPLILRGCANSMPSLQRWTGPDAKEYLLANDPKEFASLFGGEAGIGGLFPLPESLYPDIYPTGRSKFVEFVRHFKEKNYVWTSRGSRQARTHFGTFTNLHILMSEKKTFWLCSPKYARHLYIDFVPAKCPGVTSGGKYFGCDEFGCYHFLPFPDNNINLAVYPRVASIEWEQTTMLPGDVLLIPPFWFHHVLHWPKTPTGKNIAVTFIRQQEEMPKSRFAADIVEFWKAAR